MTTLEALIEPLRHSPRLHEAVGALQQQIASELQRRDLFYEEMTPEQKVEFIDGEVIVHSPARNQHLDTTGFLYQLLSAYVRVHQIGTVKTEKCLCVFPRNDYEPDVVFFGRQKAATLSPDTIKFPVPDLAVEVLSTSTERRDRGVKFEDFAANDVGEYWIVDADEPFIEQYVLHDGNYELRLKSSSGRLKSTVVEGFEVDVEAFFDPDTNLQALRSLMTESE